MHSWLISQDRGADAGFWHRIRRKCSVGAISLVGLLPWAEAASAKVYWLTVSIHEELKDSLDEAWVVQTLQIASAVMKHKTGSWTNDCDVEFRLSAPIQFFNSAPAHIKNAKDLEAVHQVPADVKVVRKINYCVGKKKPAGVDGCAWRAHSDRKQKTVIVTPRIAAQGQLWAHEFGHTTCLPHRMAAKALMTPCTINLSSFQITKKECQHFLDGPKLCSLNEPVIRCSKK
jgi:hypothetical protein